MGTLPLRRTASGWAHAWGALACRFFLILLAGCSHAPGVLVQVELWLHSSVDDTNEIMKSFQSV